MSGQPETATQRIAFNSNPARYKHLKLEIDGSIARIWIDINEEAGLKPGYQLKLNSYDLSVDIELADVTTRLRFEHPEVKVVCIESAKDGVFSAGANIFMLGISSHSHKVNFCKFTNETRNNLEEATAESGQYYLAALNGLSSGGGYELPMACEEIHLVDDRNSAVSLPEVPFLGVLPGTGGLTRLVDKRRVRRDHADIFCTLAEGIKGQKAVDWRFVDAIHSASKWRESVDARLNELVTTRPNVNGDSPEGIVWTEIAPQVDGSTCSYKYVTLEINEITRVANLKLRGPDASDATIPATASSLGADWYGLRFWRELNDAILQLRFNYEDVGMVTIESEGDIDAILALDAALEANKDDWFVREVRLQIGRVLKMIDVTARSFFALIKPGSCFAGSFFEIAVACDRLYMMDHESEANAIALSTLNKGTFPMGHGLTRLENRFYKDDETIQAALATAGSKIKAGQALELGLVTETPDDIDWDDDVRVQIEERASFSPDALTGMEANLRFVGPESMETRIFGRLSAWQNWIFTRPNATGDRGALTSYGKESAALFNWRRT